MNKLKDYNDFLQTLTSNNPPVKWAVPLKALWWDAKDDWKKAHDLVDGSHAEYADWVHAYLHRKEGDEWNAGYWYSRANRSFPAVSLEEEFCQIVEYIGKN